MKNRVRFADTTPLTEAQQALVASHAEWADAGARKHAHRWRRYVTEDDLRSAAYMGLILAARKFDPSRGLKFKTLAFTYCESLMKREVDTVRRLDGHVFDPRVEGGMRAVQTKAPWPTYDDGTPREIGAVPARQHDDLDLANRKAVIRGLVTRDDQSIVSRVLAGMTAEEIAHDLRISRVAAHTRINAVTRRLVRRSSRLRRAA